MGRLFVGVMAQSVASNVYVTNDPFGIMDRDLFSPLYSHLNWSGYQANRISVYVCANGTNLGLSVSIRLKAPGQISRWICARGGH